MRRTALTKMLKSTKIDILLDRLHSSMWVIPLGILILMIGAAQGLMRLHSFLGLEVGMAGASIEGARGMLQAVATSMVTVAGVVFSLTLLVLSQASSQYSPRVLRNFLRDRVNQSVLGVFLGVYAYCLVVLQGMGGESSDMPGLAIIGGLVAALLSVVYLVYFFHHIADSLQLENILRDIELETLPVIARLYPQDRGVPEDEECEIDRAEELPGFQVPCITPGYIQHVDLEQLLAVAERLDAVIYLPHCVGEFIIQGKALAKVVTGTTPGDEDLEELSAAFSTGVQRSIQQDPAFGIRQMADVAMKALSPGVNDTTNAIMALDRISVIMSELSARCFPSRRRSLQGKLRLVVARPSYNDLLGLSFDQIRHWGRNNPAVLARLLEVLGDLIEVSATLQRRGLLKAYARRVLASAETHIKDSDDLRWIRSYYQERIERLPANSH